MKKIILLFACMAGMVIHAQNTCYNPYSLCNSITFAASTNTSPMGGPSYGCLAAQPNPTWFYTQVTASGNLQYQINSVQGQDIDFVCWGPFTNMNNVCSMLTSQNIVDCKYAVSSTDTITIPNVLIGEYYMILITNISNTSNTIHFQALPSTGSACSQFQGITGNVYSDLNTNCHYDSTDTYIRNLPVKEYDQAGAFLGLSYQNDYGIFRVPYRFYNDTGLYTVRIDTTNLPFTAQCVHPGLDSIATLTTVHPADTINFSIHCKPGYDLSAYSVYHSGRAFPGTQHTLRVTAGDLTHQFYNLGCVATVSAQVVVSISGPVSYQATNSAIQPSGVIGNTITYTISDVSNIDIYDDFSLILSTNTSANTGDTICVNVTITSGVSGENNTSNNQLYYCYTVSNSYDPNLKETYPENVAPGYNNWFYYTVYFQNTGTTAAQNISITDTLSQFLNPATFERINYSHNNSLMLIGQTLQFNFNNINLPDSSSNSSGSKGFVQYRVKPKANLPAGTVIPNTAFIYFDYNTPVVTNTSHNNYVLNSTGIEGLQNKGNFRVYPNPTTGLLIITSAKQQADDVFVYDLLGHVVYQQKALTGTAQLDLSFLNNGVYFLKLNTQKGESSTYKIVIQK